MLKYFGFDQQVKTIVLYGSDKDLCASLQMLFQDRYEIVTACDYASLIAAVDAASPALLIADVLPTERIGALFGQLKHAHPTLKIVLFYAPRYNDKPLLESIRRHVDSVLYKPVDLETVTNRVTDFVAA